MSQTDAQELNTRYLREVRADEEDSLSVVAGLIKPATKVLDLGTGPGALGKFLKESKACSVDGIEFASYAKELEDSWRELHRILTKSSCHNALTLWMLRSRRP